MTPIDPEYEDEFAFFDAATERANNYDAYRDWMRGVAGEQVDKLVSTDTDSIANRTALLAAAVAPFDMAFKKYQARDRAVASSYPFSDYYRWWARQYATSYLYRQRKT